MLLIKLLTLDFCERREAQLSCKNLKYLLVLQRYRKELRVSATISMCFQSNLPFCRKSGAFADLWDNIKKMLKNENKSSSEQFSLAGARVQCWALLCLSNKDVKQAQLISSGVARLLIPFCLLFLFCYKSQ